MQSKRARIKKLQRHTEPNEKIRIEFSCSGITPAPVYEPGDLVIHWSQEDEFIRELIGEDGRSHYHEQVSHESTSTPPQS